MCFVFGFWRFVRQVIVFWVYNHYPVWPSFLAGKFKFPPNIRSFFLLPSPSPIIIYPNSYTIIMPTWSICKAHNPTKYILHPCRCHYVSRRSPLSEKTPKSEKIIEKKKFSSSIPSQKKVNTPLFLIIIYEYNIWKKKCNNVLIFCAKKLFPPPNLMSLFSSPLSFLGGKIQIFALPHIPLCFSLLPPCFFLYVTNNFFSLYLL